MFQSNPIGFQIGENPPPLQATICLHAYTYACYWTKVHGRNVKGMFTVLKVRTPTTKEESNKVEALHIVSRLSNTEGLTYIFFPAQKSWRQVPALPAELPSHYLADSSPSTTLYTCGVTNSNLVKKNTIVKITTISSVQ